MNKKNNSLLIAFGVSSVWFGSHVGGGFATGNQTVQYFVKYGWPVFFMPILVMGLLAWIYYQATIMAKNHNIHSYDKLALELYNPYGNVGKIAFDVGYLALTIVGVGIAIAGGGELFKETFGMNYYIGIAIVGAIFFVLTIYGANLVRSASSWITIFILICLVMLLVPGLRSGTEKLGEVWVEKKLFTGSWINVVWSALLYAGFQSLVVGSIVSASDTLVDTKLCKKFAILGFILNAVMTTLCAVMIVGYMPDIAVNKLPILTIAKMQNLPLLAKTYRLVLFLAFVSTGVGVVFGFVSRYEQAFMKQSSIGMRRIIISATAIILSTLMAITGITNLVAVGYGWIGRICIFIVILPLAIVAPIKNAKFKKQTQK